jgi:hypothetical protein
MLRWTPPASNGGSPITTYKVFRAGPAGGEALLATLGAVTEYTDNFVANGNLYTYRVSAASAGGDGPKSVDRSVIPSTVTFDPPAWWHGTCDADWWNPHAFALGCTGTGAHELGASLFGIPVCGPRPGDDSAPAVPWSRTGVAASEWDSSELAFRFMAQAYGVTPYSAIPENVVRAYTPGSGGDLVFVANRTVGVAPLPGDIISFDSQTTTGHVAVVAASSVGANGNGTVTLISQNDTASGWHSVPVTGWLVRGFGVNQTTDGWLHSIGGPIIEGRPGTGRVTVRVPTETGPRPDAPDPPAVTGDRPPPPHHG